LLQLPHRLEDGLGSLRAMDADDDGIPCENVCRSKSQVDAIKQRIGC
jgi:hypothetical protein